MEYWSNTNNNIDAVKLSKDRWQRIEENPDFAKEVLINSCKFADIIRDIKKNSCSIVKNIIDKDLIKNLRNNALQNIKSNLAGMKIRDHSKETHSKSMKLFHKILDEKDTLETAKKITNGISIQDPLIALPSILKIIENKLIQGVVTGYYESIPQLTFVKSRISFYDSIGPRDTQFWHCDPGSYRVLKALIYLNDVDEDGGPFEIIQGSHIKKFDHWDIQTRHDHTKMQEIYDQNLFKKCLANSGDVIFADATAFHRGNVPVNKNRLILILNFCVHDEYGLPFQQPKIKKELFEKTDPLTKSMLSKLEIIEK